MEQIFMIEVFVQKIILKIEPKLKDEYELRMEEEERKKEEEAAALAALMQKGKKGGKEKAPKPPKKGKVPAGPSDEETKFMLSCSTQVSCKPIFDFLVAHDNFVAPPPPPPEPKKGKGKPPKPKKGKPVPFKISLPSEPIPEPPYLGVGSSIIFLSRPSMLAEILKETPITIVAWNKDQTFECTGTCTIKWHDSFFECLKTAEENNPLDMDVGQFRPDPRRQEMFTNTVELVRPLFCEEDQVPAGNIHLFVRLSCLGNRIITQFIQLPEMERLPGRKYMVDELKLKDVEVVRHWEGTEIDNAPPVTFFFGGPDIFRAPIEAKESEVEIKEYEAPITSSELCILSMGFPKGPCGGTNCPKRLDYRGSQHEFITGEIVKGKYQHGKFVNKRDVRGPCGRLDCPLAKKIRHYICGKGSYKPCAKPCCKGLY